MTRKRRSRYKSKRRCDISDSDSDSDDDVDIRVSKNHIYFWCDVTKKTALDLTLKMNEVYNDVRTFTMNGDEPVPIYIHLNSYGGDTDAALGVIDTMESLKKNGATIITIIEGNVSSAATLISVAGTERRMRPNAYMRIHQVSTGICGKKSEIDDEHGNLGKLEEILINFYKNKTKMTKQQLKKILSREIDMVADECYERGLIDHIQT